MLRLIGPISTGFSWDVAIARICSTIYKNLSSLRPPCPDSIQMYIKVKQASLWLANVPSCLKAQRFADFAELIAFVCQLFGFQMFEVLLFLPQGVLISKTKISERFWLRVGQFESVTFFGRQHQLSVSVGISFKKLYFSGKSTINHKRKPKDESLKTPSWTKKNILSRKWLIL